MAVLLGKTTVSWKTPSQQSGVQAVMKRRNDLIIATKTNSGKSMIMILPAVLDTTRYTLGVLPLKSLVSDYTRKLTEMKVPFELYTGQPLNGQHSLILTTPDMASTQQFPQHYGQLLHMRGVAHIIIDEAHIAISASSYRASMSSLFNLRRGKEQLVLLSGTVPVSAEATLIKSYGLLNPIILRESTVRPEMEYKLYPLQTPQLVKSAAVKCIGKLLPTLRSNERILVFVPFRGLAMELATSLKCPAYVGFKHDDDQWKNISAPVAQDQDAQNKEEMMARFRLGTHKIIFATSALAAGYDYPHIRHVFSLVRMDCMLDLVQELHRGGRDGLHSTAHLMPATSQTMPDPGEADLSDLQGMTESWKMTQNQIPAMCLRWRISRFSDQTGVRCSDIAGAQRCSTCQDEYKPGDFFYQSLI
jgi:superfamily II DNA helicase RecQ